MIKCLPTSKALNVWSPLSLPIHKTMGVVERVARNPSSYHSINQLSPSDKIGCSQSESFFKNSKWDSVIQWTTNKRKSYLKHHPIIKLKYINCQREELVEIEHLCDSTSSILHEIFFFAFVACSLSSKYRIL